VKKAKSVQKFEEQRQGGIAHGETAIAFEKIKKIAGCSEIALDVVGIGSAIFARKPGDGSAREQAASCQRVLGASANLALEYATKRYRSNLINWGILPFIISDESAFSVDSWIFIPEIKAAVQEKRETIKGFVLGDTVTEIRASLGELTDAERQILIDGCLINYYARK
jgi:aconitate hydratase